MTEKNNIDIFANDERWKENCNRMGIRPFEIFENRGVLLFFVSLFFFDTHVTARPYERTK